LAQASAPQQQIQANHHLQQGKKAHMAIMVIARPTFFLRDLPIIRSPKIQ
jgi:hypothetical protein